MASQPQTLFWSGGSNAVFYEHEQRPFGRVILQGPPFSSLPTISSIVPAWPLKMLSMWPLLPILTFFQHPTVLPTWDSFHLCASFKEDTCWKWCPCPQLEPTIHAHKGKSFLSLKMRAQFFWIIHSWITPLLASMYLHPFTLIFPKCFGKPSYSHIKRWKSERCSVVSDSLWPHGLSMEFSRPEYSSV